MRFSLAAIAILLFLPLLGASAPNDPPEEMREVVKALFGAGCTMTAVQITLSEQDLATVKQRFGRDLAKTPLRLWKIETRKGMPAYAFIDDVKGKARMITYTIVFDADGSVRAVEVLKYRESHGGEIRYGLFKDQFKGKKAADPIALGKDIHNVTGATISCRSVTGGVRFFADVFDYLLKNRKLPAA